MIKEKNEETGEVKVIFSSEEFKKLKIFGGAAAVLLILSISLAGWAGYNTNALHAENELYRSQLKMADEKMQALENKAKTVEKISGQLQELVRTNGGTVPENTGMGTGKYESTDSRIGNLYGGCICTSFLLFVSDSETGKRI